MVFELYVNKALKKTVVKTYNHIPRPGRHGARAINQKAKENRKLQGEPSPIGCIVQETAESRGGN